MFILVDQMQFLTVLTAFCMQTAFYAIPSADLGSIQMTTKKIEWKQIEANIIEIW